MLNLIGTIFRGESQSPEKFWIAAVVCVTTVLSNSISQGEDSAAASTAVTKTVRKSHLELESGPKTGSTINQFFVRAVTGPHRNRSVCYVCRYGSRPVVMVLLQ
jgi:hypothetical protein